jgi:tetratricopeptide (TPR) repeat protein
MAEVRDLKSASLEHWSHFQSPSTANLVWKSGMSTGELLITQDPLVATSLNVLGNLYDSKGDYAKAERLHQRALAIREKALGPDHPDVANTLNNLAIVYKNKGDYGKPSHCTNGPWQLKRRHWGRSTPMSQELSITSQSSTKIRAITARPSRSNYRRSRSGKEP